MENTVWKIVFRMVAGLVLLAAIAGIAFFAYQAGVAHGSPVTLQAPSGQTVPAPYPFYGHGAWRMHPFFGFGFLSCLLPLFLLFLAFGAFRRMMWGPRWGMHRMHMHGHGPWGEKGVHPMFAEMHRRAHEAADAEKKEQPGV